MPDPVIVDAQFRWTDGNDQFGTYATTGHLQVGDLCIIGMFSRVGGGGNTFYSEFTGGLRQGHVSGPFGDIGDVFGHVDAALGGGVYAGYFARQTIQASDLVNTAGSSEALEKIGFRKASPSGNIYSAGFFMLTLRNATFNTYAQDADGEQGVAGAFTPRVVGVSPVGVPQVAVCMYFAESNAYADPAVYPWSLSEDAADNGFTLVGPSGGDWNVGGGVHNSGALLMGYAVGNSGADATSLTFDSLSTDPGASSTHEAIVAMITLNEDFPEVITPGSARLELPTTRLNLKNLPNKVLSSSLRGLDA